MPYRSDEASGDGASVLKVLYQSIICTVKEMGKEERRQPIRYLLLALEVLFRSLLT